MFEPVRTLWQRRPAARQAGFLLALDGITNVIDYGFHIYLARVLLPAQFAAAQTINTILLVVLTTFSVMQPVVARYVAETAVSTTYPFGTEQAIFRHYFGRSLLLGAAGAAAVFWQRQALAAWFNLPETAVALASFMLLVAAARPVVAGMLQGQRRFAWFGGMRLGNAVSRFLFGLLLISGLELGLNGAVGAMPLGGLVSLLMGLFFLGRLIWLRGTAVPQAFRRSGGMLSLLTLAAFAAYMVLLSLDLIWVNRILPADEAALYATAVLLRRALLLLPGAVIVIMFPRAVARVAQGQLPDKLLLQTAAVVTLPTLGLTVLLALFGSQLIGWTLGVAYLAAAPLLGWMGLAMLGVGITVIWLNFYLATRPLPFVLLLLATAATQFMIFQLVQIDLLRVTAVFALGGWLPALGGLLLYLFWLRPSLKKTCYGVEERV